VFVLLHSKHIVIHCLLHVDCQIIYEMVLFTKVLPRSWRSCFTWHLSVCLSVDYFA